MVDENQDKKWECPECSSHRNERRRLAAERARLKRTSQGKGLTRCPAPALLAALVAPHPPGAPYCYGLLFAGVHLFYFYKSNEIK